MDYIKQLNAFWHWRELHEISHAQADIYMALLDIFNRSFWPDSLPVPNKAIMSRADLSDKKQLAAERIELVELGLIKYTAGDRKKAGTYSIIRLYDTTELPRNHPENSPEIAPNLPPINKTKNIKQKTETKTKTDIYTSFDESDSAEIQAIFDAYNDICKSLPKAEKLDIKRKTAIRARLKRFGANDIISAFRRAELSDFMKGITGQWRANLDWFMKNDSNILKVNEGNYDNNSTPEITPNFTPNLPPNELGTTEGISDIEKQFMTVQERSIV